MFHSDDQGIIIVRADSKGIFLGKGDVNPYFSSHTSRETRRYYIFYKHLPYVFPLRGAIDTSTKETSDNDVCVVM